MPRRMTIVCTWLALASAGCASTIYGRTGKPVAAHRPDDGTLVTRPAPATAVYCLFVSDPEPGSFGAVAVRRELSRGEPVGFARGPDGSLEAVAGEYRQRLMEGVYRWHIVDADKSGGWLDDRMTAAGKVYSGALEPVFAPIGTLIALPFFLLGLGGARFA